MSGTSCIPRHADVDCKWRLLRDWLVSIKIHRGWMKFEHIRRHRLLMACVFFVIIGFIWLKHIIESVMNPEVIWPTMRLLG